MQFRNNGKFFKVYVHENKTFCDHSKLVCTGDDLAKLKKSPYKSYLVEVCTIDRVTTTQNVDDKR